MTIPHFPFRPETPLYPQHPDVQQYHVDIINHWNLSSHLRLNHEILESRWIGSSEKGQWRLLIKDRLHNETTTEEEFDHLIIANGHNHYPYEPVIEGREEWERGSHRLILHSIFYRNPEDFKARNVVVVGGGASGRDIAQQVVEFANSVCLHVDWM